MFVRHKINNRQQRATRRYYKKLGLAKGVNWGDRAGDIMVVPDQLDPRKWQLHVLGGGDAHRSVL